MGRLFGTDGIRGRANTYPITAEVALRCGQAVGMFARASGKTLVVIGKDTRISGDMLEAALAAGIAAAGVDAGLAGIIPTPGVAFLTRCLDDVGAGIVISASHNPFEDNGIKIFKEGGVKLSDEEEEKIEAHISGKDAVSGDVVGKIVSISDSLERYANFLKEKFPVGNPHGKLKLIIDASNGAASAICPQVFKPPYFDIQMIHAKPDGANINKDCGSQHTKDLSRQVIREKAHAGLAFDGDADRLIAVDENGNEITGDRILAICACHAKDKGTLKNNTVVSTTMSNIGLTKALESKGIVHLKSDVGDRKVLEEMVRSGAVMGGEDSGHMIFLDAHSTGDGILTALKLLTVMVEKGRSLSHLAKIMTVYPQVLKNVKVDASRPDFTRIPPIANTIADAESKLSGRGRVLIRYSGTQPLLRVMVEGPEKQETLDLCDKICQSIQEHL